MRLLVCVVLALATEVAFSPLFASGTRVEDRHWRLWKQKNSRHYVDDEDALRRSIFETNVNYIINHNLEADLGLHTYYLGVNKFADYTPVEYKALLGYKVGTIRSEPAASFMSPLSVKDLPASVDWRPKGYVTPVKDQGQCGSCWAFSATGSLEGQHFRKFGVLQSFSEQQLIDCSWKEGNQGCGGGWMDQAFQYVKDIAQTNGFLDVETCYPYRAEDLKCKVNTASSCDGVTDVGYVDIKKKNETDLQAAVATVGPISVAIDASHQSFQLYSHGVYNELACSQTALDHGVLAVGYGSQTDKRGQVTDYWIVKNSWGVTWGDKGYILMSRNKKNQCGISTAASYPLL